MLISVGQPKRKSMLRLPYYDYSSAGYYFITICTWGRENFFGKIINNEMFLSEMGQIVAKHWVKIPSYFQDVKLDEFIMMPNHIHGILERPDLTREEMNAIQRSREVNNESAARFGSDLSVIIGSYKAGCTRTINKLQSRIFFGWQRGYYEHVIKNEQSLYRIREYIRLNPLTWESDKHNPKNFNGTTKMSPLR